MSLMQFLSIFNQYICFLIFCFWYAMSKKMSMEYFEKRMYELLTTLLIDPVIQNDVQRKLHWHVFIFIFKSYQCRTDPLYIRGSFIKFPNWGCNFSKNQVIPLKLCNNLYMYISDLCLKFHSLILYSFIFMQIIVDA